MNTTNKETEQKESVDNNPFSSIMKWVIIGGVFIVIILLLIYMIIGSSSKSSKGNNNSQLGRKLSFASSLPSIKG